MQADNIMQKLKQLMLFIKNKQKLLREKIMEKIYAPWREKYIEERDKNKCVFCHQLEQNNDEKYFILGRFTHSFVILNLYPYNGGHLMVLPLKHKATLTDCSPEERAEIMENIAFSITALEKTLKPQGINVGINQGKAGGGGIPSHLHAHVLPRWEGDTNFMPLLCKTKAVSTDLKKLYKLLKKEFDTKK